MYAYYSCLTFTTLTHFIFACEHYHDPACQDVKPIDGDHFLNQFIAEIDGGEEVAKEVARDIGFKYKKPMKTHKNHYFFTHEEVYDRHKTRHEIVLKILRDHKHVKVADQQYVWRPTISELETYEDMVGLEEPLEVRTSHFHPDEIEIEGKAAWELIRPDDVFIEPEPIQDYPPIHTLVDFDKIYAEKNREKEKRAEERRLQEELENKLAKERLEAAISETAEETVLQDEKTDELEEPETFLQDEKIDKKGKPESVEDETENEKAEKVKKPESVDDATVLESEKIDENEKPKKVLQEGRVDRKGKPELVDEIETEKDANVKKPESVDDETVLGSEKIDKNEKCEKIDRKGKPEPIVDEEIIKSEKIDQKKLESIYETFLKNQKIDEKKKPTCVDAEKIMENQKIGEEKAGPEFEGKTEQFGVNEDGTAEDDDDEATVETYEE